MDSKQPETVAVGSDGLLGELRSIITDQINRHVAMTDTHRAWLASDISQRVCALVADAAHRTALEEIEREASSALNNAMPEDAPDILNHIKGIATRALYSPNQVLAHTASDKKP